MTIPLRYNAWMTFLILGMSALFLWAGFQPDSSFHDQRTFTLFLLKRVAPVVGMVALVLWVSMNVLGRSYLRISRNELEHKHVFWLKRVAWKDVLEVRTYSFKGREMLGIVTRSDSGVGESFWQSATRVNGVYHSISIPKYLVHTITLPELRRLLEEIRREGS